MAEKDSLATCHICCGLAVSGRLEREEFEKRALSGKNQKGPPKFTEMQRKFAAHPEVTTNPRKAAVDSGYSRTYAKSHAIALREQLSPLIMQYQEIAQKRAAISVAKVQQELAAMGFANVLDYFDIMENGQVIPKKLNELTREQASAIQEMKLIEVVNPVTGETEHRVGFIKLADKRANLVELGKTLGMFNPRSGDDSAERQRQEMLRDVPTEDLEAAEAMLMSAVAKARDQKARNNAVDAEFRELPAPGAVEQEDPT